MGVEFRLEESRGATLSFETEVVRFEAQLDRIGPEPHVFEAGGVRQRAWVQRINPAPGPAEVDLEFHVEEHHFLPGWNPYFVKITQEDGEMAWSSPILVYHG